MQVLRLEIDEEIPNVAALYSLRTVADYESVQIGGKPFWVLTRITKTEAGGEWIAEYSNCRKFEVSSEIRPVR